MAGGHEHHRLGADLQPARDLIVDLGLPVLRPHVEDHLTGTVYGFSLQATSKIEKTGISPFSYFLNFPEQCCKKQDEKGRIQDECRGVDAGRHNFKVPGNFYSHRHDKKNCTVMGSVHCTVSINNSDPCSHTVTKGESALYSRY